MKNKTNVENQKDGKPNSVFGNGFTGKNGVVIDDNGMVEYSASVDYAGKEVNAQDASKIAKEEATNNNPPAPKDEPAGEGKEANAAYNTTNPKINNNTSAEPPEDRISAEDMQKAMRSGLFGGRISNGQGA